MGCGSSKKLKVSDPATERRPTPRQVGNLVKVEHETQPKPNTPPIEEKPVVQQPEQPIEQPVPQIKEDLAPESVSPESTSNEPQTPHAQEDQHLIPLPQIRSRSALGPIRGPRPIVNRGSISLSTTPLTSPRRDESLGIEPVAFEVKMKKAASKRNPVQARLEEEAKKPSHKRSPSVASLERKLVLAEQRRKKHQTNVTQKAQEFSRLKLEQSRRKKKLVEESKAAALQKLMNERTKLAEAHRKSKELEVKKKAEEKQKIIEEAQQKAKSRKVEPESEAENKENTTPPDKRQRVSSPPSSIEDLPIKPATPSAPLTNSSVPTNEEIP